MIPRSQVKSISWSADVDAVDDVVLEHEPQLALEQRVRHLELPHGQVHGGAAEVVPVHERVLHAGRLASFVQQEVEVVGKVSRERGARDELEHPGCLEVRRGRVAAEDLELGVRAHRERDRALQREQLVLGPHGVRGVLSGRQPEAVARKQLAVRPDARERVVALHAADAVAPRERRHGEGLAGRERGHDQRKHDRGEAKSDHGSLGGSRLGASGSACGPGRRAGNRCKKILSASSVPQARSAFHTAGAIPAREREATAARGQPAGRGRGLPSTCSHGSGVRTATTSRRRPRNRSNEPRLQCWTCPGVFPRLRQ